MIKIVIQKNKGLFTGLNSSGHSSLDFGSKGSNPVCAGVSALLQTLVLYLQKENLVDKILLDNGVLAFQVVEIRNPKLTVQVDHAFQMIVIGLEEIQKKFPQEVKLEIKNDILEEARAVS